MEAEDPEVAPMIARCVLEKKTLTATYTYDALCLADVVVVDVQCDYFKETLGNCRQGHAEIVAPTPTSASCPAGNTWPPSVTSIIKHPNVLRG